MSYFKVTALDGEPVNGGTGRWDLPVQRPDGTWKPGRWRTVTGPLKACENGLHLAAEDTLIQWLGPAIWEAEVQGEVVDAGDKVVARKVRLIRGFPQWTERAARLFAVECAEDVLHLVDDPVCRLTCEVALYVARCHADGEATDDELAAARAAAWYAARDAAWDAARDAARAAASAAAWYAAWDAAWDAARDAASAAASAAAWYAAWAAASAAAWYAQSKRLMALLEVQS